MHPHGCFAYPREDNVGRYFLESRLMQIAPVPQEMVLNYVAEHVLRLPRSY
jgi:acyl-CoA dehydrogenase